jgi:Chaperone of endosialidase
MANVGTAASGKTLIGSGLGASPTFVSIGTNSGLTAHGVILGQGNGAFTATTPGFNGQVLTSNGISANPTFQALPAAISTINGDTGSITGSTVTIQAGQSSRACGTSILFSNSGATSTLQVSDASHNTVLGNGSGALAMSGNQNSFFGGTVGPSITSGSGNSVYGYTSGLRLSSGSFNTVFGTSSYSGTTGQYNIVMGYGSGANYLTSEGSNICIGNVGTGSESNVIRIGSQGTSTQQQNTCFIAGITGATVTGTAVLCSSSGQLGTIASSKRYKENIKDIGNEVSVLHLKPKSFNYKNDKEKIIQYGLIAEDVHEDFPYLCFYNDGKQPDSVKYHELCTFLLVEVQRLHKRVSQLEKMHAAA